MKCRGRKALVLATWFTIAALTMFAGTPSPATKKFVAFACEFSRMSVRDLVAYADELDKTPLDGIGVYLNEKAPDGTLVSTHNIMRSIWRRDVLEPLVPTARELTAHPSLRESFVGSFRAPAKRIEWGDDAGWALVASNMTIVAWFAKAGGFRGLSMDPEDYRHAGQFIRMAGDVPYDELCALARRRGCEVFEGVFREYPDVCILSFWFLSLSHAYLGSDDPARDARERGDLWPAFVDGILDVMPPEASVVDGNEHSYRYEAKRGEFARAALAMRHRLPNLVSPENRAKFLGQVEVSFGLYLDMYTNPIGASWYFGPENGSRVGHFAQNLVGAAETADEYVWFWGEKHCWADWKGKGPDDERKISSETWNQSLAGFEDEILAVKSQAAFLERRLSRLSELGVPMVLNANPECAGNSEKTPAPYSPWQQNKCRQGRLFRDATCGDGDNSSLAAEGVENGAFSVVPSRDVVPGERFLVSASAKGDGASALVAWKRNGKLDWDILPPVQLRFDEADGRGWRRGTAFVRVPESANGMSLILSVRQREGEKCNFDNVRITSLEACPDVFTLGAEAIGPDDGHVQGIAATEDALFLAQMKRIVKVDWSGKVLKVVPSPNHTGDIAWHGGRLYAALSLESNGRKVGAIRVFDGDLNLVKEAKVDRGIDGITCMNGVLYVGMGAKTQPSSKLHRVNVIGRFDADTLAEIAPRAEFDYGIETMYGFQDLTNDGKNVYAAFYVVDGNPPMVVFDSDLNVVRKGWFDASQGFDVAPARFGGGKQAFVWSKTGKRGEKCATCTVRLWIPQRGDFL